MDTEKLNSQIEEEPQSMLMRLIAKAKRRMAEKGEDDEEILTDPEDPLEKHTIAWNTSARESSESEENRENASPKNSQREPEKMGKSNQILMLKQKMFGMLIDGDENVPYSDFIYDHIEPDGDQKRCLQAMQRICQQTMQAIGQQEAIAQRQTDPDAEPQPPTPVPAKFYLHAAGSRMRAWGFVTGPIYGGEAIKTEDIMSELERQKVVFGVNEKMIERIVKQQVYFLLFPIAEGRAPVHGADGSIEDLFQRDVKIQLTEKEDATVDYKNLNWIQKVRAGESICNIIPPTEAISGINILGAAVQGRDGKKAVPPKGKNTEVTDDELRLIASVEGQVEFHHGQFHVEQLTTVRGDVDNSTGNLDVIGNVVVSGDVREGFVIKATGDIAVKGKVEGAFIIAGGNIQIGMGMNGSLSGSLEAKGDITTKYLENCTVHAGGNITSDSVVNSNVSSDKDVNITYGLGAIIGGTVMAANNLHANLIGNKSNRTTVIILGATPGVLKEKIEIDVSLKQVATDIEEVQKNLQYLGRATNLLPEHKRLQNEFKLKLSMLNIQQAKLRQRQSEIIENLDPCNCRMMCKTIYPITQVTIGNATKIIRNPSYNCNIFYSEGEVRVGTC